MKEIIRVPFGQDGMIWHHKPLGRVHFMHHHDELEFNLVVRGSGVYLGDDRKYALSRNTLIWLWPEQEHLLLDMTPDYEMWILVFTEDLLRRSCRSADSKILLHRKPQGHFCKTLPEYQAVRLRTLFSEVKASQPASDRFNAGLAYILHAAWAAQRSDGRMIPTSDVHPAVEKAAQIIHNEQAAIGVEELAKLSGLSPSRLSRLFKEQTGVSLVEYRNKQRLQRFLSLYGLGRSKSMSTAALEAGFGSYVQFHRIFKELMNSSPAAYRRGLLAQAQPPSARPPAQPQVR